MLIHKDGKTYRVRKDGKFDRRYKASWNAGQNSVVGKDIKKRKPLNLKIKRRNQTTWQKLAFARPYFLAIAILFLSLYFGYNATGDLVERMRVRAEDNKLEVLSPLADEQPEPEVVEVDPLEGLTLLSAGQASWYGVSGDECLGCRADRLMKNGNIFNETAMTLAHNSIPMNTAVKVKNVSNGKVVDAKVTDTGGFGKYNRVADLSKGLFRELDCSLNRGLCDVEIYEEVAQ